MTPKRFVRLLAPVLLLSLTAMVAWAQIPDKFTNLKVLPKDVSKQDLMNTMRGFTNGLGVRCEYCHASSTTNPNEPDFASDQKPEKTTARVMMQMTGLINTQELPKITTKHPDRVDVRCRTCHRGIPRPILIGDLLASAYKSGGLDSLKARYEGLRSHYYGSDSFNFSDRLLPQMSESLGGRGNPALATALAEYNLHWFPQSGYAHLAMGQAEFASGDNAKGEAELKKALELDPSLKEAVDRMRQQMQNGPPGQGGPRVPPPGGPPTPPPGGPQTPPPPGGPGK
jgi:hypothetical protein